MPTIRAWLTRCHGGRSILTALPPVIWRIRGTPYKDVFEQKGEPLAVRYLCEGGVKSLFGKLPPYLEPKRVELTAKYLDDWDLEPRPGAELVPVQPRGHWTKRFIRWLRDKFKPSYP